MTKFLMTFSANGIVHSISSNDKIFCACGRMKRKVDATHDARQLASLLALIFDTEPETARDRQPSPKQVDTCKLIDYTVRQQGLDSPQNRFTFIDLSNSI